MSTPNKRLRQRAMEAEKRQHEHEALQRDAEARRKQIEARVKHMESVYLAHAQFLAHATGKPIQVWRSGLDSAGTGFRIRAGGVYSLVARLVEHGWEVTTHSRSGNPTFTYRADQEFENEKEQLLEPVIASAFEALLRGTEPPLPVPPPSAPRAKAALIPLLWQKIHGGLIGLSTACRKLVKMIALQAAGLGRSVFGAIRAARPPRVHGRTKPDVHRSVPQHKPSRSTPDDVDALIQERLQHIRELSRRATKSDARRDDN